MSRSRRWIRRGFIAIAALAGVWFFRAPLLRSIPALLIVDSRPTPLNVIVIVDGVGAYDQAARLLTSHPDAEVWLFPREPNRLQRRRILPSSLECASAACEEAGIVNERIRVQPQMVTGARSLLDHLQVLAGEQAELQIGLITDEWNSRWLAGQVHHRMQADVRRRVELLPIASPGIDRTNWWHSKPGRRRVAEAALKLAADWLIADSTEAPMIISDQELRQAGVPK